jgi:hypothetical protein
MLKLFGRSRTGRRMGSGLAFCRAFVTFVAIHALPEYYMAIQGKQDRRRRRLERTGSDIDHSKSIGIGTLHECFYLNHLIRSLRGRCTPEVPHRLGGRADRGGDSGTPVHELPTERRLVTLRIGPISFRQRSSISAISAALQGDQSLLNGPTIDMTRTSRQFCGFDLPLFREPFGLGSSASDTP